MSLVIAYTVPKDWFVKVFCISSSSTSVFLFPFSWLSDFSFTLPREFLPQAICTSYFHLKHSPLDRCLPLSFRSQFNSHVPTKVSLICLEIIVCYSLYYYFSGLPFSWCVLQDEIFSSSGQEYVFFLYFFEIYLFIFYVNFTFNFFLLKKFIYLFLFSYNCLHFLPFPPPHPSQSLLPPPPLLSPLILSLCPL